MMPGTTQAVASSANICGRSRSGMLRPIATYAMGGIAPAPKPCTKRPDDEDRHRRREAADHAGRCAKRPRPPTNGTTSPSRSIRPPTTAMPRSDARRNAEKTQP